MYFQSKKCKSKIFRRRRRKKKKKQLDRLAEGDHVRLRWSIKDLLSLSRCRSFAKSVVFGVFKSSCTLLKEVFYYPRSLIFFFQLSRAEPNFSQGRWRPRGNALSMARQPSVGWARVWLISAAFWSWIEKVLISLTVFETKNEMRVHTRFALTCNIFRVSGVIVRMPYLPSRKVRWANSIWISPISIPLTALIWAFRSADFLRWCLSPKHNLTHNLFFYFQ